MVKCSSEIWICDACGKKSNSDDWWLITQEREPIVTADIIILKCPNCGGSEVYKFVYHSHIKVATTREKQPKISKQ